MPRNLKSTRKRFARADRDRLFAIFLQGNNELVRVWTLFPRYQRRTVTSWWKKFQQGLQPDSKRVINRRSNFSENERARAIQYLKGKKFGSTRAASRKLKNNDSIIMSHETVRKIAVDAGLVPHRLKKSITLLPIDKVRRLDFARKYKHQDWSKLIATDEKSFLMHPTLNRQNDVCWDTRDRVPEPVNKKREKGINIWAAIGVEGPLALQVVPPRCDSKQYVELIKRATRQIRQHRKSTGRLFLQDGAAIHRSAFTQEWFENTYRRNNGAYIPASDWPARSPDLNPIQNLWAWMDGEIKRREPSNLKELQALIENLFWNESHALCKNLILSMPNRMDEVVKMDGDKTRY